MANCTSKLRVIITCIVETTSYIFTNVLVLEAHTFFLLKEKEETIEHACETLSKLRPQLYYKKPDIENDDPTTWYKESGLIAQGMY